MVVTSSAETSARSVPTRAPSARIVAIAAVTRSLVTGVARVPLAQPARSVLIMPRLVATNAA
jgi:hypothetical protein